MSNITCIFCGQHRNKAKEHIWPRWLQKKMIGTTQWPYSGTHRSTYFFPVSVRQHTGENLVLGEVCDICNNGWMADLENQFRPILEKIESKPDGLKFLEKKERAIVATWSFKTALVINAGTNYRKIVPPEHYSLLEKHRSIVRDVKVDAAYIGEFQPLGWIQTQLNYAIGPTQTIKATQVITKENNYNVTMQIGNLGLRVAWYKDCKELGYKLESNDNEKIVRLWPFEKNPMVSEKNCFQEIDNFQLSLALRTG